MIVPEDTGIGIEDGLRTLRLNTPAIRRLKDSYPGSRLELWRKVYWLMKNIH